MNYIQSHNDHTGRHSISERSYSRYFIIIIVNGSYTRADIVDIYCRLTMSISTITVTMLVFIFAADNVGQYYWLTIKEERDHQHQLNVHN